VIPPDAPKPWGPLLSALVRRNRELGNPAAAALVDRLRNGAVAVVAGQQVGLFGGPIYAFLKALEAIRIAARLEESGRPAVPVFWMATDDHDLVELFDARLADGERGAILPPPPGAAGNRLPVGALPIGPEPAKLLADFGITLPKPLEAAFLPERSYAESFARCLVAALEDRPILLVEASLVEVKWALSDVLARWFREIERVQEIVATREREISAADYELQLPHRPGQCHLFWLDGEGKRRSLDRFPDGRIGPRDGLEEERQEPEVWARLAEEHADKLSVAALARPLAASRLFPQAVAVLGPSEIAYWAQSRPLFDHFELPMPELAPRPHVFFLESAARRLLDRLDVGLLDVLGGSEELLRSLALREIGGPFARFRAATVTLRHHLAEIEEPFVAIDPTLRGTFANASEKISLQINLLLRKGEEAAARRDEIRTRQAERIAAILRPDGIAQERRDAMLSWALRIPGLAGLVAEAIEACPEGTVIGVDLGRSASSDAGGGDGV
jgi:bacillithiol biosynthesis cysteine-adding enzyme BshC